MASIGTAYLEIQGDYSGIQKGAKKGISPVAKMAGAAIAGGVAVALKGAITEAREAAKTNAQTNAVLKSTGGIAKVSAKEIGKLSTALSEKAGVDDELIQSGANLLLTFTKVRNEAGKGNDIFNQGVSIATDMSAALGQDMKSSAIQVGKALNNPIKGVTALQRVGVAFTDQQKDQIKTLVESGRTLDAQKLILRELKTEFAGSAAAQADPLDRFNVSIKNLQESVGLALLPSLSSAAASAATFVTQMQTGEGSGGRFAATLTEGFNTAKTAGVGFLAIARPIASTMFSVATYMQQSGVAAVALGGYLGLLAGRGAIALAAIGAAKWAAVAGAIGHVRNAFMLLSAAAATGTLSRLPMLLAASGAGFTALLGPVGLAVAALAGAGIAYMALRNRSSSASIQAIAHAQALDRARNAMQQFRDAELDSKDADVQWRLSRIETRKATEQYNQAVSKYGRNSEQAEEAALNMEAAQLRQTRAYREMRRGADAAAVASNGVKNANVLVAVTADHTREKVDTLQDVVRQQLGLYRRYPKDSAPVNAANRQMRGSVANLDTAFNTFGKNLEGGVNSRLTKLGASQLSFNFTPYAIGKARGGGLTTFGNAGGAGRDRIPANIGGTNVMVGSGEKAAVFNRHQQSVMDERLSDFGGLDGFFSTVNKPHYHARGGNVGAMGTAGAKKLRSSALRYLAKQKKKSEARAGGTGRGRRSGTLALAHKIASAAGLVVGSTYRSPGHNASVNGVKNSMHTHGSMSNPGATDLNGPVPNLYKGSRIASKYGPIENLVHDVGSGLHLHLGWFARGGKVTQPSYVVGEEAPRYPEFILSTNPRDRKRSKSLWTEAAEMLGITAFRKSGKSGKGKKPRKATHGTKAAQFDADLAAAELTADTADDEAILKKRAKYFGSRVKFLEKKLKKKGLTAAQKQELLGQLGDARRQVKSDNDAIAGFHESTAPTEDPAVALAEAIAANTAAQTALADEQRKNREFADRVHTANKSVTDTTLSAILDRSLGGELSQLLLTLSPRMAT